MVQNRHQNRRFIGVYGRIMHNFNFFISLIARLYVSPKQAYAPVYVLQIFYKIEDRAESAQHTRILHVCAYRLIIKFVKKLKLPAGYILVVCSRTVLLVAAI